ncbi:hypothetical protein [Hyalangium minutum]|uniref:Uncharacterized protein n=1 Tax=Hyalangium minutum TaxID=394096 RepID=A0A085WJZ7_9BACT|nr:hypothetical protein [Hyalangium minutum]KFE68010.1 hypothetical protein DB31_7247 [Hyalangium minutum]
MDKLKTVLLFTLVGGLIGNVVATFTNRSYQVWNNTTPLATETKCNLPQVVHDVTTELIHAQALGAGIGALVFLVLGIVFVQARAKKQRATPPAPPAAPTPTAG